MDAYRYELKQPLRGRDAIVIQQDPGNTLKCGLGRHVWKCAELTCRYIEDTLPDLKGKTVLELGSGTGLVGFMAFLKGAKVCFTDLELALPLLRINVESFCQSRRGVVAELDWMNRAHSQKLRHQCGEIDYILGCEVLYDEFVHQHLEETLIDLCGPNTRVLMTFKIRENELAFFKRVSGVFKFRMIANSSFLQHSMHIYEGRLIVKDEDNVEVIN